MTAILTLQDGDVSVRVEAATAEEATAVMRRLSRPVVVQSGAEITIKGLPKGTTQRATDRVPPHYIDATWRNMTPIDPDTGRAGIGFQTANGPVFLRLTVAQLEAVRDVISDQLLSQDTLSQSPNDRGSPKSDVLTPVEVLK